jgi:RNA polymerase sigma factor (sigma-70 family)
MGALQHSVPSQPNADRPFAVKPGKRRRAISLRSAPVPREKPHVVASAGEDQTLIRRAVTGDSEAQAQLFSTHTPKLFRIAFKVLRNKEDAEDAIQDTWSRAYARLHTFEGRSSLSTWLTRIAINSALMIRRRNKHRFEVPLNGSSFGGEDLGRHTISNGPTPEEAYRNAEMNDRLSRHIARLSPVARAAFLLRDVNGFTHSESMKLLGIRSSALKSRVQRARRKLAQDMLEVLHKDQPPRSVEGIVAA